VTTQHDRSVLKSWANVLVAYRHQVDYPRGDVRGPLDLETFNLTGEEAKATLTRGGRLMGDCSGILTDVFKWAGLRDPNGLDYRRQGYTGSMLETLPHYHNPGDANVGALVVFGPGTGEHVAMVMAPGDDPMLYSHGYEQAGPPIRLSLERTYHSPPVTFLNITEL
jgi:hypothetical protein